MNKNTLFTLLVLLLTSFISVNASENKAIDIPAAVWQSNKLTAYRLEVLDNLLGERGVTDERIGKSFTIAAWVNLRALPAGGMSYIMGTWCPRTLQPEWKLGTHGQQRRRLLRKR